MGTDADPSIEALEEGWEVEVWYTSQRSLNEVSRRGTVTYTAEHDDGHLARIHVEQVSLLKHKYVALADAATEGGRDVVAAYSLTMEAEEPWEDEPPKFGSGHLLQFEPGRKSLLGVVDRIARKSGPGAPYLVTGTDTVVIS